MITCSAAANVVTDLSNAYDEDEDDCDNDCDDDHDDKVVRKIVLLGQDTI